ncbi:MAG TPA: hypothetical protein VK969_08025, partial [Acidimicrobiia bacterium]|nr:hypothetical protein [Acidimicrobiia bacterium]
MTRPAFRLEERRPGLVPRLRTGRPSSVAARLWSGRTKYLLGAICVALVVVMITPILFSVLAS